MAERNGTLTAEDERLRTGPRRPANGTLMPSFAGSGEFDDAEHDPQVMIHPNMV